MIISKKKNLPSLTSIIFKWVCRIHNKHIQIIIFPYSDSDYESTGIIDAKLCVITQTTVKSKKIHMLVCGIFQTLIKSIWDLNKGKDLSYLALKTQHWFQFFPNRYIDLTHCLPKLQDYFLNINKLTLKFRKVL